MLPGTGGLTRVTDKRRVRKDRADVFATKSEGMRGQQAVDWRLVDEVGAAQASWDETVRRARGRGRGAVAPARPTRHGDQLPPLAARGDRGRRSATSTCAADLDRGARHRRRSPCSAPSRRRARARVERIHELGADFWPLAMTRELDDLILRLRTNELELGTWVHPHRRATSRTRWRSSG